MHYLLRYSYVENIDTLREPFREEHLRRLWDEADAGRVLLAGGAGDPVSEGVILFDVDDPSHIHQFAEADPYMGAGLITEYEVLPWRTVVGDLASNPIRP